MSPVKRCSWCSVNEGSKGLTLAPTLESILVDVTNAGYRDAKGRATGAMKQEGWLIWEGCARLVHEDIDGTPYLLLPFEVIRSTHQEVLPPAQGKSGDGRVKLAPDRHCKRHLLGTILPRAMQLSK